MLITYYFPYVSTLNCRYAPASVVGLIRDGKMSAAAMQIQRLVDGQEDCSDANLLQMQGDLLLTLDMEVDADESYREAQKCMLDNKDAVRFTSCRNAGWQALFRLRYGTAMSCFMQIAEHGQASIALRLDALFGVFGVLFSVGRLRDADAVLDRLEDLLDEAATKGAQREHVQIDGWQRLLSTVRYDVEAQSSLRSNAALSDHIYWQVGVTGDAAPRIAPRRPGALRMLTGAITDALLRNRVEFLNQLSALTEGKSDARHEISAHAEWAGKQGIKVYQNTVRIEVVLACLAGGASALAESVLTLLTAEVRLPQSQRQLEYLYCVAKLRHIQGRSVESLDIYRRYAIAAVACMREEAGAIARFSQRITQKREQMDDIAARLPARYRRAYRYLHENLDRKDLSVREISAQIGVTERALQTAFKTSLGSTPTEIIRRLRMEGIRADLEANDSAHEQGILAAAQKWGVGNRSTLVNSYRREFNESPSETLNR